VRTADLAVSTQASVHSFRASLARHVQILVDEKWWKAEPERNRL